MDKEAVAVNVFFEQPFWVGVFECISNGKLSVSRVVFGAEPKDYEVYQFILKNYYHLRFSPAVAATVKVESRNPKRILREAHKQTQNTGIGTKSQQALKLQQEQQKIERKTRSKEQKEAEELRRFELKQQKRKEKHKEDVDYEKCSRNESDESLYSTRQD